MKKLLQEFKEFALRGNVMDLAVGVIIGAAFQAIINSLVNDVISPLIGLFANTDLTYLSVMVGDVEIRYGAFLTAVINFIIMAVIIFLMQGTKVMVEGEIVTGNYEDKDTGKKIYTTEVYANRIEFAGAKMVDRPPFPEDAEGFLEIPEGMEEEMPFR